MKLLFLKSSNCSNISDFIKFWSAYYNYSLKDLYNSRIHLSTYTKEDLEKLFEWKNGMVLSAKKNQALKDKVLVHLNQINQFKQQEQINLSDFQHTFKGVSAVWKIFLLHLIKPDYYPIYDQHIHRAYFYINRKNYDEELSLISKEIKEQFYFEAYLSFVHGINGCSLKQIDEALFSFGKFLKTSYAKIL